MVARLSEGIGKSVTECVQLYQDTIRCDNARGEGVKSLIQMLHRLKDWENAYVFSLYGLKFNKQNPYPNRILFLDTGLYDYEMLELHSLSCFYTKRSEEGSMIYWNMRKQLDELGPSYLSEEQSKRILSNEQYFPKPHSFRPLNTSQQSAQKLPGNNFTPPKKKRKK
jgi:hypothetical protein